ncbi:MAG: bacillithiol biosynthesis deacetylase BshB2 [Trueperaceae bacterium]|nr:bacillithiol biosynthesis deacetylase BshB2 [Trueperaceae bacterium]MCC6310232.1 bacillithiol biosynthesis deacetylase BshB2 [Trueperaceae bacterium]MCO5173232.1 bacillithiol biosynthesis deacetylase BshB2 [Trueperaceae bacterium]MCW5818681.1 bacillithiol biosynthesis deacetylase BshB2 [Trueperaceae bacterium]
MLSEAKGRQPDAAHGRTVPFDAAGESAVLAVFPHPDDESFAAGGTLALCNEAGVRTVYLCGTYGDMGRRMGRPAFTNREALRDVRTVELSSACAVLGCELGFMGLRDKCIEFEDPAEVAAQVRRVIDEIRPSTVITYYPGHGVHSDHDALGHATVLAVRALPAGLRPRVLAVAVGDPNVLREELGEPHVRADIRGVKDRKLDALRAHRSQTESMFAHMNEDAREDGQTSTFSERLTVREEFYVLDADAPTLVERARG